MSGSRTTKARLDMGNKLGLALVSSLAASAVLADVAVGFKEQ